MSTATQNCEFCHSPAHIWFNCPKKPDGWKPKRLTKSLPAAQLSGALSSPAGVEGDADRPPISKRGRPKTITDMRAYKADKARERRARLKAAK